MAISLVGTDADFVSSGGNITRNLPVGTAQGDVVYAALAITQNNTDNNLSMNTSGYTELCDIFSNGTNDTNFGTYRKIQGSTPDATAVANGNGNANCGGTLVIYVLRGVNQTTPEDATTTTATGTGNANPNAPSITTVTDNAWVLACGGGAGTTGQSWGTSGAITAPTSYSNLDYEDGSDTDGSNGAAMSSRLITSAGAENPAAYTSCTGNSWAAASIAVRPATGPAPITADAGSYALTGTAATLKRGLKIAAAVGSYAVAGQPAALKQGRVVAVAAGSYGLTGQAVSFVRAWRVGAAAGGYDLSGQAAGLARTWKISAGVGSYTLNGQDAALILAGDATKVISADAGSYSLTGAAASPLHARVIAAGVGGYSLGGQAASLLQGRKVVAGAGSYGLTGAAAQLLQGRRISAGVGSYSLDGQTVTLKRTWKLIAEAGSYALTGSPASLDIDTGENGPVRPKVSASGAGSRVSGASAKAKVGASPVKSRVTVH